MELKSKKRIADYALIAFVLLFPHFLPLPFYSYAVLCLLVVVIYLKKQGKTLTDIGLKRNGIGVQTITTGIVCGLIWVAFMQWVYIPLIHYFFKDFVKPYPEYDFIRNNPTNLFFTILAAWVIGGFYEEIIFRGFIQSTIQEQFNSDSFWFAGLASSLLFGLYHWQQGIFGIIPALLAGLFWTYPLYRYKEIYGIP